MLRITEQRQPSSGGPVTLVVEGRLVGPWVEALRAAAAAHQTLRLDLVGLSYADAAGAALLGHLVAGGAEVIRSTAYSAALLGRQR